MRRLQVGLRFATICIGSGMSDIGGRMRVHIAAVLLLALAMIGGPLCHASIASAAATNKDAVAVIIGNKDYAGTVPDVDFAHNAPVPEPGLSGEFELSLRSGFCSVLE